MTFNYNVNIPAANDDPSDDQPLMQTNTNSINSWCGVDHYGFNDNVGVRGGLHKQCRLVDLAVKPTIPASVANIVGTLYTKKVNIVGSESSLLYMPDSTGNEYQMTRTVTAKYSLFGLNTNNYTGSAAFLTGGWTFLPGGILFQYGSSTTTSNNTTITFPVAFTATPYCIQLTTVVDDNSTIRMSVLDGSVGLTTFKINSTTSSHSKLVYWTAIGI